MGRRTAEALVEEAELLGAQRIFLLVSSTLRKNTQEIAEIESALGARLAQTYDGIAAHAPRTDVLKAMAAARAAEADLIITVGGGSVTDAGKVIALGLKHNILTHEDFEGFYVYVDDNGETVAPVFDGPDIRVICCPTTLSGGEFNTMGGVTDDRENKKQGYTHRMMAPIAIVLDPALTLHTPEWLWHSTGVRAVDHALESLSSNHSSYFCDGVAESALRLLSQAMPEVKADPANLDARLRCQIGAWQSMIPIIGGVPMGASHAIGHVLGGTADVPHGYCSCVMAPAVLAFNKPVTGAKQVKVSDSFGRPGEDASVVLDEFIRGLGMPRSLGEVGVDEDQLDLIAEYTMLDFWSRTNPREITGPADVRSILEQAL
ncbi:MAG: iron-containing alcohol dehydrogenase [Halieaceae bacterium]|jgi:maleylacetate reductase|nr:iron-containing alcohol dehydrogenase [Halieaceae bacterium]MBT5208921.1 iron-containing alcohol dehydrogenase [Halieaceae bacterium]MBT6333162.1 iron-containing alcohol dehydrogenase [Halieaceae bacterium]